jgi:hypothetical protein
VQRIVEVADGDTIGYERSIPTSRFEVLKSIAFTLGVPHASTEDDVYNGFLIPKGKFSSLSYALQFTVRQLHSKGAIVMANAWYVIN